MIEGIENVYHEVKSKIVARIAEIYKVVLLN